MPAKHSTQRMFRTYVSGITGYWPTKTGGETSADVTPYWDGGRRLPEMLASPAQRSNVTVSRAYNRDRDYAIIAKLRERVGEWTTTISHQPTDEDGTSAGKPNVYSEAVLVRLSEPDSDASGGDAAMFELEFAVSTVK